MSNEDPSVRTRLLSPSDMNKAVIQNEVDGDMDNEEPDLSLHDAVYEPDSFTEDDIQELIDGNPSLVYVRDGEGKTPLHTLALAGEKKLYC
jgi:ankyrin repeat protein